MDKKQNGNCAIKLIARSKISCKCVAFMRCSNTIGDFLNAISRVLKEEVK